MRCDGCNDDKIADQFYWRKDLLAYRQPCKECIGIKRKEYYVANADSIKARTTIYREQNKDVIIQKSRKYNNRADVKARAIIYRQVNKSRLRKKEKEWRLRNPDKARAIARRKSYKQRQKIQNKLRYHISRQVHFAITKSGAKKGGHSVLDFLDYTILELIIHIESQFEDWMTWKNYGRYIANDWQDNDLSTWTWQIDHIIPQSDLPFESMGHINFKKMLVA